MFIDTNVTNIDKIVRTQFPEFYQQEGQNFIAFVQAYYQWLQQPDNVVGRARSRYKNYDIDSATSEFLEHFKNKYMWGLPPELLGNQTLLQKHIIELYRSKGSEQSIRLLFRLLFNQDIEFYIPSYDVFKLSDNNWIQPTYIEVSNSQYFDSYIGNMITGADSNSTAIVESYEQRYVNGNQVHLLFLSNINGKFAVGEKVTIAGISIVDAPQILGSVTGLNVTSSSGGIQVGDVLDAITGDKPVSVIVNDTYSGTGSLTFTVDNPGSYYTLDAVAYIVPPVTEDFLIPVIDEQIAANAYGFPKFPLANAENIIQSTLYLEGIDNTEPITGSGAEIKILSLKDTQLIQINNDILADYTSVALDATNYGFPEMPTANLATIMSDAFSMQTITVGSVDQILVLNPGANYTSNAVFRLIDPVTSQFGILDANNDFVGMNATVLGVPSFGDSLVSTVVIGSSGYNNTIYPGLSFIGQANNQISLVGTPEIGAIGFDYGYYENTNSFLSSDKYLYDGFYYQDFSYVIRSAFALDKYVQILRDLVHPAGNAVYGDIRIVADNQLYNDAITTRVIQS